MYYGKGFNDGPDEYIYEKKEKQEIYKMRKHQAAIKQKQQVVAVVHDLSNELPEDILAKLQLVHDDIILMKRENLANLLGRK